MGTNIYLVKEIKDKDIKEIKDGVDKALSKVHTSRDISELKWDIQELLDGLKEEIHICKRSVGWQLLFAANRELYPCTWKGVTEYIRHVTESGEYKLIDEYGDPYSLKELKEDLDAFKDGHTGISWDEYCRKNGEISHYTANFEFISDGLRWTDREFC